MLQQAWDSYPMPSKEVALQLLDSYRRSHPIEYGWVEKSGGIEKRPDGHWYAYCTLVHYTIYL